MTAEDCTYWARESSIQRLRQDSFSQRIWKNWMERWILSMVPGNSMAVELLPPSLSLLRNPSPNLGGEKKTSAMCLNGQWLGKSSFAPQSRRRGFEEDIFHGAAMLMKKNRPSINKCR